MTENLGRSSSHNDISPNLPRQHNPPPLRNACRVSPGLVCCIGSLYSTALSRAFLLPVPCNRPRLDGIRIAIMARTKHSSREECKANTMRLFACWLVAVGSVPLAGLLASGCSPAVIEGQVLDVRQEPLPGAAVTVDGTHDQSLTNALGRYTIDFAPGKVLLRFIKTGYTPGLLELTVNEARHVEATPVVLWHLPERRIPLNPRRSRPTTLGRCTEQPSGSMSRRATPDRKSSYTSPTGAFETRYGFTAWLLWTSSPLKPVPQKPRRSGRLMRPSLPSLRQSTDPMKCSCASTLTPS